LDFYRTIRIEKKDGIHIRPDWKVGRYTDLMTRGKSFYAIWDEERGLWSTDIYDVQRLVDADLERQGDGCIIDTLNSDNTKIWDNFQKFIRNSGDNYHNLDEHIVFANTPVKKRDYASRRLDYPLERGDHEAWDILMKTLYNDDERAKIEWAIGAVVSGESKHIQKFLVFYGPPGSGKSTTLHIIQMLFDGYVGLFDARELAGVNNAFSTTAFKANPLVAIQHDGDLSKIYDNSKLNSIVAHEVMSVNEKYKAQYLLRSNAFLFMGTNVPVRISDAKSGLIRRLIDVVPTQDTIEVNAYHELMERIQFELGAIAQHCLDRYLEMGKNYYNSYRPTEMMLQTDVFYNFVEYYFDLFKEEDGVTLKRAWELYKTYCTETGIDKIMPQYRLREELKNYFSCFEEKARVNDVTVRSYYNGFKGLSAAMPVPHSLFLKVEEPYVIRLDEGPSNFDAMYPGAPAQYTNSKDNPKEKWADVKTTLSDIDTSEMHYVKVPENHVVIDFDLVNENGEKDLSLNLREAASWTPTYAEVSRSGEGIHLHYLYTGDVSELASTHSPGIEIKAFQGNASLRRKLTRSNNLSIVSLSNGLPIKERPMLTDKSIQSEKGLRELIARNLRKEIHPGTKPSVDFIKKILDEAHASGMAYDVRDMRSAIVTFAAKSTNNAVYCLKQVQSMEFVSEKGMPEVKDDDAPLVFFDVEVYPNLFVVCWKVKGADSVVRLINPEPKEIEPLFSMKLVGFNNRRYDNHIIYARYLGYSLEEIFNLSQKIVVHGNTGRDPYFGEAYNISYADIYDFSSKKQGLKRFMIELGLHHMELDLPWDQDVPKELWPKVVEYCVNDVVGTELVFENRLQDFVARQILAEISGMSVNHTTQAHTAKIIFGDDKSPQRSFIDVDLSLEFPGYNFDGKESTYKGEVTGEGGYVYAEPGIYEDVALLDIASMHPTTIQVLNLFGPYTEKFVALKEARLAIKRKDYATARQLLEGKLAKFLTDDKDADALAYALKIVINIVYGLTFARFPNPFRDSRNKDNVVAKRGALFMIDLREAVQEQGFTVVHIKTDSVKIPHASPEIIADILDFGKKYGYEFEHEKTYDWFCLVNDAVYIARCGDQWTAVGTQFQHPYVFKTLLSKEELVFDDFCELKNVQQGTMYLDFGKGLVHVGRTGSFVPVMNDGGDLWRIKDDRKYAVSGTKNRKWITREMAVDREVKGELKVDMDYFEALRQEAVDAILQFSDGVDLCELTGLA
jgi:hypothetical protein